MSSHSLLLYILLDAFRPDYLQHTPHISALARQGAAGRLQEPFGFTPRDAYFGGLTPSQTGYSNMFWMDPGNTPFGLARFLSGAGIQSSPTRTHDTRRYLEEQARLEVTPYVRSYLTSLDIPLQLLPYFSFTETQPPWSAEVPYRSLFAILNELDIPWFQCSWPTSNNYIEQGDGGIVAHTLRALQSRPRFGYVHLTELDGAGHTYGPESSDMIRLLGQTDQYVRAITDACYQYYDSVDLVFFGDHGMLGVIDGIDLWAQLQGLEVRVGIDYMVFLDSTMARFWFWTASARRDIPALLETIKGGHILSQADCERLEIDGCDPRNGELYFLLEPGYIFTPNFFHMNSSMPVGMHGYDPAIRDNQGVLIINSMSRNIRGDLGTVQAPQLFHTALDLLKIDDPAFQRDRSALAQLRGVAHYSRFTTSPPGEVDTIITGDLERICKAIHSVVSDIDAIVVAGGFGRGEGSIIVERDIIRPLNDYDILVISRSAEATQLGALGKQLADELGIDFVDIGVLHTDYLATFKLTLFTYDLAYGSQTIWGDPTLIQRVPRFASADIPLEEGVQLLFNRVAGLLLGFDEPILAGAPLNQASRLLIRNQLIKAFIAIGDWYLLMWKQYACSYRVRAERWSTLAAHAPLLDSQRQEVWQAYQRKLEPASITAEHPRPELDRVLPMLKQTLHTALLTTRPTCSHKTGETLFDMLESYPGETSDESEAAIRSARAAVACVLFSIDSPPAEAHMYLDLARRLVANQPVGDDQIPEYSVVRRRAITQWELLCH